MLKFLDWTEKPKFIRQYVFHLIFVLKLDMAFLQAVDDQLSSMIKIFLAMHPAHNQNFFNAYEFGYLQ